MIKKKKNWSAVVPPFKPMRPTKPSKIIEESADFLILETSRSIVQISELNIPEGYNLNDVYITYTYDQISFYIKKKAQEINPNYDNDMKYYNIRLQEYKDKINSYNIELKEWKMWRAQEKEKEQQKKIAEAKKLLASLKE